MNKRKFHQSQIITFVLALLFIIICLLSFVIFQEKTSLGLLYDQESRHALDATYRTNRITFCYNNAIHPCTDDAITTWNNSHPQVADQFNISPPNLPF